ncbi:MAG: carbonate dehydratase [Thermodesulfobacteriota bacterium]
MDTLQHLLDSNRAWADAMERKRPGFFATLARQQAPGYLWIGCADSRVPANEIVGLLPGEMFVHRNVANLVLPSDLSCLSVLQFAIEVLRVRHVIVCGHYGCGGVRAALDNEPHGLIDNWIRPIKDVAYRNRGELGALASDAARFDRLCELNVAEQVASVAHTTIVQDAWRRGQALTVRGWIYRIDDGLIRDLGVAVDSLEQVPPAYRVDE